MPITELRLTEGPAGHPLGRVDSTGAAFAVRPYLPTDRRPLEDFYETFRPLQGAQGLPPRTRPRLVRWLDTILGRGMHLLVLRGSTLIGHALMIPIDQAGTYEYAVFVGQRERGKGIGTELGRIATDFARRAGARTLWLSVEPRNRAAIRSYEKVGFRFRPGTVFSPEPEMVLDL